MHKSSNFYHLPEGEKIFSNHHLLVGVVHVETFFTAVLVAFFFSFARLIYPRLLVKGKSWIQMFPVAPLYNYGYTPLR